MSTLADSFLEDLAELSEGSDVDEDDRNSEDGGENLMDDLENSDEDENENEDIDAVLGKVSTTKSLRGITNLRSTTKYKEHMDMVNRALECPPTELIGALEDDPEYQLVVLSNAIIFDIDDEIASIHRYVADIYAKKFPELESLIPSKIDYLKTVLRIGNEMDMTVIELGDLLPSATVMVVSVTGSTTSGSPLSQQDLDECFNKCNEVISLEKDKGTFLQFIESRMSKFAPNTCILVGSRIAAQLIGMAGSLLNLAQIPSCNVQVMGQSKSLLSGYSNVSTVLNAGILLNCDIVQKSPPYLRKKAVKLVAAKLSLIVRIDSHKNFPNGDEGKKMRRDVEEKLEKLQEPPKAKTKKSLPVPEDKKRNKRGGKRVRRWKERFAMTEMRAQQNKMNFTTQEGEYGDSAMGFDMGMLSSTSESGKLRAPKRKDIKQVKRQKVVSVSSGQTNGLSSSLVFTPVQGLELVNPNAAAERVKEANKKWFNTSSGFLSAAPK